MNRRRMALVAVASVLPFLLALTNVLGRTTYTDILFNKDGSVAYQTGWIENDNGDNHEYNVCSNIGLGDGQYGCHRWCSGCHIKGEDKSKEVYTVARHKRLYYPAAATSLSEGQKLSLNESGAYLTSEGGRLKAYYKEGALAMVAPTGSMLLKDGSGRQFLLSMPLEPKIQPPPR